MQPKSDKERYKWIFYFAATQIEMKVIVSCSNMNPLHNSFAYSIDVKISIKAFDKYFLTHNHKVSEIVTGNS